MANYIPSALKKNVFERAKGYCEYCQCPFEFSTEPFAIEHILPRSKNGRTEAENLALSCTGCNIYKSDKIEAIDLLSENIVPLFNPRTMAWNEHFMWDENLTSMIGKTAIARATIEFLKLNRNPLKNLRRALIAIGEHPPL